MIKQNLNKVVSSYKNWRRNSQANRKRFTRYYATSRKHTFLSSMRYFKDRYGIPDGLERTFIDMHEGGGFIEEAYQTAIEIGLYTKAGLIARRAARKPGASYAPNHKTVIAFSQEASRLGKKRLAERVAQEAIESYLKKGPCEVCLTCNYENALDIAEKTGLSQRVAEISLKIRNANRLLTKMGYNDRNRPNNRNSAFGGEGRLDYRQIDRVKDIIDGKLVESGDGSYRYRFPVEKLFE